MENIWDQTDSPHFRFFKKLSWNAIQWRLKSPEYLRSLRYNQQKLALDLKAFGPWLDHFGIDLFKAVMEASEEEKRPEPEPKVLPMRKRLPETYIRQNTFPKDILRLILSFVPPEPKEPEVMELVPEYDEQGNYGSFGHTQPLVYVV